MTEQTLEQDQEQAKPNLGEILVKAREAANISVASLASQLNLDVSQLTDLENNKYKNLGPEIFIKGYIKSYCKVLNLDLDEVMLSYQSCEHSAKEKEMQSFSNRFEKETHDSRLMIVSYIFLSVVLGSSGVLWWQNQSSTDDVVINTPVSQSNSTEKTDNAVSTSIESEIAVASEEVTTIELPTREVITEVKEHDAMPDLQIAKVNEASLEPNQAEIKEALAPDVMPEVAIDTAQVQTAVQEEVITVNKIIMRFSGDSWVEIFDATGDRVAFGVKKSGYVMTVHGVAPFSVVLGKHQLVTIELDGENVDTSSFPTNRLAKFQLPLSL